MYYVIQKILVVEDDLELRDFLHKLFVDSGYQVLTTTSGVKALRIIERNPPDLVILDLGLPDLDGETVLKRIKEYSPKIPVVVLTAKTQNNEIINGLNNGADDYIAKPFSGDVLLARIKARLKEKKLSDLKLTADDLVLDREAMTVHRNEKLIKLTRREYELLEFLLLNKNRVLPREAILNKVWYYTLDVETRVVDVYIGYLRKKIDRGHAIKLIHSIKGFGYMLKDEANV